VLNQGLRFDGTYKNAWTFLTLALVSEEEVYMKALDELRSNSAATGFRTPRSTPFGCWRARRTIPTAS
jgi:hypothetical protein